MLTHVKQALVLALVPVREMGVGVTAIQVLALPPGSSLHKSHHSPARKKSRL